MSASGLVAGKIRFFSHSAPALEAGTYRLTAEQTVDTRKIAPDSGDARTYSYTQPLQIRAPRFRFGPDDVHSVYPPPFSEGEFTTTIPHIVLRRRTLPWERTLDGLAQSPTSPRPWLALLLFRDAELADVTVRSGAVKDLMLPAAAPAGIALPQFNFDGPRAAEKALELEPVNQADPQVTTIDIKTATFLKVAPKLEDLKWLAHVRQVNTGDKELLGLVEDGWFSLVLSNRVPSVGGHTAHLVSLEGCNSLLAQVPGGTLSAGTVRLVSLASWTFSSRKSSGNFAEIVNNLDIGPLRIRTPEPLNVLASGAGPDAGQAGLLKSALEAGYAPLTYRMRHGEVTAAWYRGPLTPVPTPRTERDPFPTAEAGLIYDSAIGMFDVSNAVAWQIGRLLALSDARFGAALAEWRQAGQLLLDAMIHQAQDDQRRANDTIWRRIGEIYAEPDPVVRKQKFDALLRDEANLREMLESLQDPASGMKPLADRVIGVYEEKTAGSNVQSPQNTKARLLGEATEKLVQAYASSAGMVGIFAAAAFRDEILGRKPEPSLV